MQEHLKLKFNNQEASDDQVLYCQPLSAASVWVCVRPAVSHCRPLLLVLLDPFQTQMQVRIQHESSWQAPSHAVALALFVRSCFCWVRALLMLLPHCMLLTGAVNLSHHHQTTHLEALIPQAPESKLPLQVGPACGEDDC